MRGGSRPGSGRKPKNAPDERSPSKILDDKIKDAAQNLVAAMAVPPMKPGQRSAIEMLREISNALFEIALSHRPGKDAAGKDIGHEGRFRSFASDAANVAGKLAPFEGPTYSSVRMIPPAVDLSKLTTEQLRLYEQLTAIAAADPIGDQGGDRPTYN